MTIAYFIYFILFTVTTAAIFTLSAMMLLPKTRVIFKSPVPYVHNTIAKVLIPWGVTYLLNIPDIYLDINGLEMRQQVYDIISMIGLIICLPMSSIIFLSYLQQNVKQRKVIPLILALPVTLWLWYTITPAMWLMKATYAVSIAEGVLLVIYYARLYPAFVRDLKSNYSSISQTTIHSLWAQWASMLFTFIAFILATVIDNAVWDILNIIANILTISVLIYSSENLLPIPEVEDDDLDDSEPDERPELDLAKALRVNCEEPQLFCDSELSLQDLALAVGTNRTYLSKWFVANNTTFYNYINGLRVEYAARLLKTTTNPVSQIQIVAGFTSKATFRKYFVEKYGCTPSDYRK